jgi:hypothetical protein
MDKPKPLFDMSKAIPIRAEAPNVDTGGIALLGIFLKYFGPDSPCPLVGPSDKTPRERVN